MHWMHLSLEVDQPAYFNLNIIGRTHDDWEHLFCSTFDKLADEWDQQCQLRCGIYPVALESRGFALERR